MADPLQIRNAIDDDLFTAFQSAGAVQQKEFIDGLDENELTNLELRISGQYDLPDEEFANAIQSFQLQSATAGDFPVGPDGMPMYDLPTAGSRTQDIGLEIYKGLRENDFDYSGLPNSKLRRGLSFMDTAGEKESYLTDKIGPEGVGWTMDKYGRYAVMPEFREKLGGTPGEMPLTIDNPGKYDSGDISDLAGSAPELVAAVVASIAARNLSPLTAAMSVAGATGAAKTMEELTESALGTQQQSVGEIAKDVRNEALLGGFSEIGGRVLLGGAKAVFSPGEVRIPTGETTPVLGLNFKTYTYAPRVDAAQGPGVTETQTLVRELLEEGAIPDVEKATGRGITGKVSGMIEQIFGYNKQKNVVNVKYMMDKVNKFLTDAGAEPFDPTSGKILKSLNQQELGSLVQLRIANSKSVAETAVENSLQTLRALINTETKTITETVGTRVDDPGTTLNQQIFNAFDDWKLNVNKLYNDADNLLGKKPVIPTEVLKQQAKEILENLPKTQEGKIARGIDPDAQGLLADILELPSHISSVQMASYRTLFGDAAYSDKLLLGVGARNYGLLKDATNTAFDLASNNGLKGWQYIDKGGNIVSTTRKIPANELKQVKLGLKKLDEAKTYYKDGMELFDKKLIKTLTTKDGVDPARIVGTVVKPNSPVAIKTFLNATDDPKLAKSILQAAHWDDMILRSTNPNGELSIAGMLSKINTLGTTYPALYGEAAPILKNSLNQLNSVQKIIPVEDAAKIKSSLLRGLETGKFGDYKQVVKNYVDDVNKQFDFYDANFSQNIGKSSPEEVMPWLMNKAKSNDLTAFINYYQKSDPAIVENFKQNFMENILETAFVAPKGSPVGVSISGEKLLETISDPLMIPRLNAVFGEPTADALLRFAQKAEFLTTKSGSMAGAFAANSIALSPLDNVGKMVKLKILGGVLANPTTLKYLTTIVESPVKRNVGFAVTNLGTDIIAQIQANDPTVSPDQIEIMRLELQNGVAGLLDEDYNNYEDEESE